MTAADIAVYVFLGICVLLSVISCWALVLFKDAFERMHYLSAITTISTFSLLVAVTVKEGWGQATIKTILAFVVLLLINAVVTHATARAARVRMHGNWPPTVEEHIERAKEGR